MKFIFLIPALCLSLNLLYANEFWGRVESWTSLGKTVYVNEHEVPDDLPLPTIDYEFEGHKLSEKAKVIGTLVSKGKRSLCYGFTTSIRIQSSADIQIYYKGRKAGKDEWVLRWEVDDNGEINERDFIYKPGVEQVLVDAGKFKVSVK